MDTSEIREPYMKYRVSGLNISYVVKIIPLLKNISLTGVRDLINGVSIDERRGIQFRGTQVIRVFRAY